MQTSLLDTWPPRRGCRSSDAVPTVVRSNAVFVLCRADDWRQGLHRSFLGLHSLSIFFLVNMEFAPRTLLFVQGRGVWECRTGKLGVQWIDSLSQFDSASACIRGFPLRMALWEGKFRSPVFSVRVCTLLCCRPTLGPKQVLCPTKRTRIATRIFSDLSTISMTAG